MVFGMIVEMMKSQLGLTYEQIEEAMEKQR